MLASDDIHLDWCFSTNSLWSTRYFKILPNVGRVKSSVDDLTMERGTVSMRVAFVLRSAEVQPLFRDLCEVCKKKNNFFSFITEPSSPPLSWNYPLFMSRPKNWCVWLATADRRPLWMPCVQNIKLVPVPGIDLLSEKEHPGSFGRHYLLHTTTNL